MHVRRMALQLTPLLDLLLIVIFAQYMEVRIVAKQQADRVASEQAVTSQENESLRRQVDMWQSHQQTLDRSLRQERDQMGRLIRELFKIPETTVEKLVQPRSKTEGAGLAPSEIADLKARMQQLANAGGEQVVDHLLTFNEMRKQFDLWEFYLNEDGELMITIGPDRPALKSKPIETPEAFVDTVLQVRRQFPPTKANVLILCRYGDCQLLNRLAMTRGLPSLAERMKGDGQGTIHFDYAVLGYRPQKELDK